MSKRTALVAGGTSGIGLASARKLRGLGYDVHITGRGKERLDSLLLSDPELTGHQADGTDATAMSAVAETIGNIDALVVSIGVGEGMSPFAQLELDSLRRAFDAKFWAHLTTIQAVLPRLAEDGSITLVSAISARASLPGTAGLAAVNGAIEAMISPLAVELAPRRINAVSPGLVDTPWWNGMPEEERKAFFAQITQVLPSRHLATPEDIAEAVVLVAANRNMSGTVIEADGGGRLVSFG